MANRYYRMEENALTPPKPSQKGKSVPGMAEKTMNWPKAPGPKGKTLNKVGFPSLKAWAVKDGI